MTERAESTGAVRTVDAVVVGAGFAGLYMAHRLRNVMGMSVAGFEAAPTVGGTWYWNCYPGARCDSDGYIYCYSFDEQLLQEWTWSGKYPMQAEILSYLEHVADRFDLKRSFEFETFVHSAVYDDETERWTVKASNGETIDAKYFISAIGTLTLARYVPNIPGLDEFGGEWVHTANWPQCGMPLGGRKVGVIGTGSTGVQLISTIAKDVGHLTVFQRRPQFSIPARHETMDPTVMADIKANYPTIWETCRASAGGFPFEHNGRRAMDDTELERRATYDALWQEGGMKFALASYRDLTYNREANSTVTAYVRERTEERIPDPNLRKSLIPDDHVFMARRVIIDTNYFEQYQRDNVDLVDLRTTPIARIVPQGIELSDGRLVELDLLVFATGFDAMTGPFLNIDIRGREDISLKAQWGDGPHAYLGIQTVGFPNMFMITGPTSTMGNLPLSIETHVEWISGCIEFMEAHGVRTVEATATAQKEWSEHVTETMAKSLLSSTNSWYNGSNIPGKPKSNLFYLGHFGRYRELCFEIAHDGYRGFAFTPNPVRSAPALIEEAMAADDEPGMLI